jgi:hypothetical protein
MDPLSWILAAVLAGAATPMQATVADAVKDAYAALKRIVVERYRGVDLTMVERDPKAPDNRRALERQLREAGVSGDVDLLSRAKALLDEVARSVPRLADVVGVDIGRIKAGTIRIEDIVSAGSGVRLKDAVAAGDFVVSGIRAGASDSPGKR